MGLIFASADIATIVANFQPLSIVEGRPLLIRSRSGGSLISAQKACRCLQDLLKTTDARISRSHLSTLLDIEEHAEEWIYEGLPSPPYRSKSGHDLIALPESNKILEHLLDRLTYHCLELHIVASDEDIALESLHRLLERNTRHTLRRIVHGGAEYVCSQDLAENIKFRLRGGIKASEPEMYHLPSSLSDLAPHALLKELLHEVAFEDGGEVRLKEDQLTYVPPTHMSALQERRKLAQKVRVKEAVRQLQDHGWSSVCLEAVDVCGANSDPSCEESEFERAVQRDYESVNPHDLIRNINISSHQEQHPRTTETQFQSKLLITSDTLQQELDRLKDVLATHIKIVWKSSDRAASMKMLTQALKSNYVVLESSTELGKLLLRSECVSSLLPYVHEVIVELEQKERDTFCELVQTRLVIPVQLYAAGIQTVEDATLKQHLEEFVFDHLRNEMVPSSIDVLRNQLPREKEVERHIEKLHQAIKDSKSLTALRSAVEKLAKRLKLDAPDPDHCKRIKDSILRSSVRSMRKMKRGSDVLQNLTWVLLATNSEGLFISSGKDTSRMIKHFGTVGDESTTGALLKWRDALKAADESQEDLHRMFELAERVVREIQ